MPYIKEEQRKNIDAELFDLSKKILETNEDTSKAGILNYSITKLIMDTYGPINELKYKDFNEIIGMLECCKLEFYKEMVSPYEEFKKKQNGAVEERTQPQQ